MAAADAHPGSKTGRVIAVANQKGGVGKSTTAVSLGAALAEFGHRVLVVDLDPQGNASTGLGIRHESREVTVYDVLAAEAPIDGAIVPTQIENLFAIPSTIDLAGAEIELVSQFSRELRLRRAIEPLRQDSYDFVFLDCPPSLGLLTVNALAAAEELLVPIQCEYYALEGLGQLLRNVRLVQQNVNTELRLSGIVMTMFDPRTKLSEQVVQEVRRYFGDRVYRTIIPRTVRLSEAPGFGQPITVYDPGSKGATSYRELALEIVERLPDERPLPSVDEMPNVVIPRPEPAVARAPRPLVGPDDEAVREGGTVEEPMSEVPMSEEPSDETIEPSPLQELQAGVEPTSSAPPVTAPAVAQGEGDAGREDERSEPRAPDDVDPDAGQTPGDETGPGLDVEAEVGMTLQQDSSLDRTTQPAVPEVRPVGEAPDGSTSGSRPRRRRGLFRRGGS